MDDIRRYLDSRQEDDLSPIVGAAKEALVRTQTISRKADDLLAACELAQGSETTDRHQIEETRQTLGALSREAWNAHESLRLVLTTLAQLTEVEARLATQAETVAAQAAVEGSPR